MTFDELMNGRTDTPLLEDVAFRALLAACWSEVQAEKFVRKKRRRGRRANQPSYAPDEPTFDNGFDFAEELR